MSSALSAIEALRRIAAELPLNAKRITPNGGGVESWYPYYAGFSNRFARLVLENAALPAGATVLDPWNGSGTTTHIADQLGHRALGFDLNPVAALVANAKLARPRDAEHVLGLAERVAETALAQPARAQTGTDPLSDWLKPSVVAHYRAIERAILADLATGRSGTPLKPQSGAVPPLASFLLLALMRAARSLAALRASTNPTWITPGDKPHGTRAIFTRKWLTGVEQMAEELALQGNATPTFSETRIADACCLPVAADSIDLVLTSPPYCTRIDYVISTSFELAALGIGRDTPEFDKLRRACMGAPLARSGKPAESRSSWPTSIRALLDAIKQHPSKASKSYYYKTYWQYFNDCERALIEMKRCLRPGGTAVLVVQSSYYKNICVDLPQLYVDLGTACGFRGTMVSTVDVRRALAQINTRSQAHRTTTTYQESVITLEKAA